MMKGASKQVPGEDVMKRIGLLMLGFFFIFAPAYADPGGKFYKTFEVVEVTEKRVILQNSGGQRFEISRSRRPDLKKGDKVRYDYVKNRLGETLPGE